jgi:hypothetical protein
MPHQCLNCGKIFEKGSPHLLKGCPDCGGKKFFYTKKPLGSEERERLLEKEKVDMDAVAHIVEEREGDEEWMHIQPDNIRDILQEIREQKRQVTEEVEQESRRVESIDVDDPGSYRINVKRLLDDESIVIHRDGSYLIHLPSLFTEKERREK